MCGLTGYLAFDASGSPDSMTDTVRRMARAVEHRGPDDSGEFVDASAGIALGFRRLAIIDLSPAGHQPMRSHSGRYVVVFNGEIYNFQRLRKELEQREQAPPWRGHSDTEVMLAAIEAWGLRFAVERFIGMFSIALWDRQERRLTLVRDRVGIKPLYYGISGGTLLFGSELKSLLEHPASDDTIDREALALYMRFGYVPSPDSIYSRFRKLPPGTLLEISTPEDVDASPVPYWDASAVVERAFEQRRSEPESELIEELDQLIRDSVSLRMVADVPLGVFLSGGIDSSLVAAAMQAQSTRRIRTFSIGFTEKEYDEAPFAAAVARHLGTDHTEMYVSPEQAMAVIPKLPLIWDEPFGDSSQIPTYLVSSLARQHVTVSLSGDGGDELFAGYNRYFVGEMVLGRLKLIPPGLRRPTAQLLRFLKPSTWDRIISAMGRVTPAVLRQQRIGDKMHKLAGVVESGPANYYRQVVSHWNGIVEGVEEPSSLIDEEASWPRLDGGIEQMMYLDLVSYLPGDILTKVDRASMAVGLESREPLLDHRLIELAWSLPISMRLRKGRGKLALRKVLSRYVPDELIDRPKMGFGIPLGEWLRGPLREWSESHLHESRLRDLGLSVEPVRKAWSEHLNGAGSFQHHLWFVLMYSAWEEQRSPRKLHCKDARPGEG